MSEARAGVGGLAHSQTRPALSRLRRTTKNARLFTRTRRVGGWRRRLRGVFLRSFCQFEFDTIPRLLHNKARLLNQHEIALICNSSKLVLTKIIALLLGDLWKEGIRNSDLSSGSFGVNCTNEMDEKVLQAKSKSACNTWWKKDRLACEQGNSVIYTFSNPCHKNRFLQFTVCVSSNIIFLGLV